MRHTGQNLFKKMAFMFKKINQKRKPKQLIKNVFLNITYELLNHNFKNQE